MTTEKLFTQLEGIRDHIDIPLVLMGYFNPMMQYGIEKFVAAVQLWELMDSSFPISP